MPGKPGQLPRWNGPGPELGLALGQQEGNGGMWRGRAAGLMGRRTLRLTQAMAMESGGLEDHPRRKGVLFTETQGL